MSYTDEEPMEDPRAVMRRDRDPRQRDRRTVGDHLDRCHRQAALISEDLDALAERLMTALAPERPTPAAALDSSTEDQSALADNLDRHARDLDSLHYRLRSIIERVDL